MFRDETLELTEILMQFQTLEGLVEAAMITRSTMLITSRSVVVIFISTTPDKTASFTKPRDNSFMNDESCHLQTLTFDFFVNSRAYLKIPVDA